MHKKLFFPAVLLILSILACSIPGVTETPSETESPGEVTDTPTSPAPASELRVAYARGGNIWLWSESGGSRQLTFSGADSAPRIASDGAVVAFRRGEELWAVNSDGSGERLLVSAAYLAALVPPAEGTAVLHWFAWQPASHSVYFGTSQQGEAFTVPVLDLHRVDADSGAPPSLLLPAGAGGWAYFSPDGRYLAVSQPENILLFDPMSGSVSTLLSFEFVMTYSEWFYLPEVTWKADASGLWTVIPAHDSLGVPTEPTEVWYIPLTGGATLLDSFVAAPVFVDFPRLSPDGTRVLYVQEGGGSNTLLLRQIGGGEMTVLTAAAGQFGTVGWAPDSNQFVYWNPLPANAYYGYPGLGFSFVSDVGTEAYNVRWVDAARLLFLAGSDLRLRTGPASGLSIDSGVEAYDFTVH
ncbi:MAG: hypothetical protein ABWK53_00615 [Anaerolineales bacterium]